MKRERRDAQEASVGPLRWMPAVVPDWVMLSMVLIAAEGDITEDRSDPVDP